PPAPVPAPVPEESPGPPVIWASTVPPPPKPRLKARTAFFVMSCRMFPMAADPLTGSDRFASDRSFPGKAGTGSRRERRAIAAEHPRLRKRRTWTEGDHDRVAYL